MTYTVTFTEEQFQTAAACLNRLLEIDQMRAARAVVVVMEAMDAAVKEEPEAPQDADEE